VRSDQGFRGMILSHRIALSTSTSGRYASLSALGEYAHNTWSEAAAEYWAPTPGSRTTLTATPQDLSAETTERSGNNIVICRGFSTAASTNDVVGLGHWVTGKVDFHGVSLTND